GRRSAAQAVALVAPLEVVVLQEPIQITLNLGRLQIPGRPARDPEALVEQRAVHALDEAVGAGGVDPRRSVLDPFHGEQQLVGVLVLAPAELPAVVGEDRPEGDAQGFVEGQDAVVEEVAGRDRHLGRIDLGEGEGAEDVDDDLDVDLADALEGAPVERVVVEELTRAAGLDVTATEVDAVALEEADLLLGEDEGGVRLDGALQAQEALQARFEVVAEPHPADAGWAHRQALQPELVGDALGAVGGVGQGVGEDPRLDLGAHAIGVGTTRPAPLLDEGLDAADLEGAADLIERVAMVAHETAGLGDVAELLGKLQQRELASGTLGQGGHSRPSWMMGCLSNSHSIQGAGWSPSVFLNI